MYFLYFKRISTLIALLLEHEENEELITSAKPFSTRKSLGVLIATSSVLSFLSKLILLTGKLLYPITLAIFQQGHFDYKYHFYMMELL